MRGEFPALNQTHQGRPLVFFDGPGGTQLHGTVIEAMRRYLVEANSNVRGAFLYSQRTDETVIAARQAMADLVNAASPDEVVFGPNMTSLTFSLSRAIGRILSPGDEIVVTQLDHDANVAPWRALEERGAVVRVAELNPGDCTLDMGSMAAAITRRTRVVALGYASNAVGTINDVRRVVDWAHAVGAWAYVDAVHYAPHGLIDVSTLGCDFLVCSAYKFFGPRQGILYGRYELLDSLSAYKVRPADEAPPHKFETGTQSFEAMAGTTAAVDYLASIGRRVGHSLEKPIADPAPLGSSTPADAPDAVRRRDGRRGELVVAMEAIRAYERALCRRLIEGLQQIPGLHIYGIIDPPLLGQRVPTVSFTLEGFTPSEIALYLADSNIFVWDGNFYALSVTERLGLESRGGLVRVGLIHYNTEAEVDALLSALSALRR